jgi:hypothetical protein
MKVIDEISDKDGKMFLFEPCRYLAAPESIPIVELSKSGLLCNVVLPGKGS